MVVKSDKIILSSERVSFVNKDMWNTIKHGKLVDSLHPKPILSPFAKDPYKPKAKCGIYLVNIRVLNSSKGEYIIAIYILSLLI